MAATSTLKLVLDDKEYEASLKTAKQGMQDLQSSLQSTGKTFTDVDKSVVDYTRAIGDMAATSRTAKGRLNEMTQTFTELSVQYKNLTDEEKNSPFGKALSESLDKLKGRIQNGKNELASINNEISGGGGLTDSLDALAGKFGLSIKSLTGWGAALGAWTAALKVAKDAFFNNDEQLDEWGRIVKSSESIYNGFLNALNTGDISGFLENIGKIEKAARDAYDALDDLGTYNAFNQINVEKTRTSMTENIASYREGSGSKEAVKAAGEAYKKELKDRQRLEKDAYLAAVKDMAAQRGVEYKDLLDALSGNYGHYQDLKKVMPTGTESRYVPGLPGMAGRYDTFKVAQNDQERLGEALRRLNDTELQSLQALGAQAERTGNEIASVDKQLVRVLNGRQGSGAGGGSTIKADATIAGSIDEQTKKVQELQKAWRAAADDDSRLKIKKEIEEQQYILDRMTGKETFDPSKMTALKGMSIVPEIKLEDPLKRAQERLKTTRVEIETEIKADATKVDTATLHTLLKDAIQSGIDDGLMNMTFASIGDQIAQGINVPDEAWQKILDQYNALREQIGMEPISLDFKTGNIDTSTKDNGGSSSLESSRKLVSGLSSVSSGLQQMGVKLPDGVQKVLGGIQGLMTVIQGVQSIISIFNTTTATTQTITTNMNTTAMTALTSAVIANTAAVTTNTITPSIFAGGGVVHAESGYVGGSHFSGDLVPALLNSGELVLNQAQQGNIASQLQAASMINGGGGGGHDYVSGQNIYLGTNNYLKGSGQGQLVTTRMLRQYGLIN